MGFKDISLHSVILNFYILRLDYFTHCRSFRYRGLRSFRDGKATQWSCKWTKEQGGHVQIERHQHEFDQINDASLCALNILPLFHLKFR